MAESACITWQGKAAELVLNEGSDLQDFSDSGSDENIVESGEEFVPVDLEADEWQR